MPDTPLLSKEQLKDKLGDAISNNVNYNDSREVDRAEELCTEISVEYAMNMAIAFNEWKYKNGYQQYNEMDMYFNEQPKAGKQTYFTIADLYTKFLNSINK